MELYQNHYIIIYIQLKPTKFIKDVSYKIIEFILYAIDSKLIYWAQAISIIQHISLSLAQFFYFTYLILSLELQIKNNLMLKNEIPYKLIEFCKIINIIYCFSIIPYQIIESFAFKIAIVSFNGYFI